MMKLTIFILILMNPNLTLRPARLHRNTDYIDCPALSFLFLFLFYFSFFLKKDLDILDGQNGKPKLA